MNYLLKNSYNMICGSAEAERRRYIKYIGRGGRIWLVADQPNAADNIYVEGGPGSDGFGGRTLSFNLIDGTTINLQGPWHSNSDSLFAETGVDVRNKYYTWGLISADVKRDWDKGDEYINVIHIDPERQWVLGTFKRIDDLANKLAEKLGQDLFYYSKSQGGSHASKTNIIKSSSNSPSQPSTKR